MIQILKCTTSSLTPSADQESVSDVVGLGRRRHAERRDFSWAMKLNWLKTNEKTGKWFNSTHGWRWWARAGGSGRCRWPKSKDSSWGGWRERWFGWSSAMALGQFCRERPVKGWIGQRRQRSGRRSWPTHSRWGCLRRSCFRRWWQPLALRLIKSNCNYFIAGEQWGVCCILPRELVGDGLYSANDAAGIDFALTAEACTIKRQIKNNWLWWRSN